MVVEGLEEMDEETGCNIPGNKMEVGSAVRLKWTSVPRQLGRLAVCQVLPAVVVAWMILYFVSLGPLVNVKGDQLSKEEIDQLKQFIKDKNPDFQNFSYSQLDQWFKSQTPPELIFEEYPRLFPFCVTARQINDSRFVNQAIGVHHIKRFQAIFEGIDLVNAKFYDFDVTKHSMTKNTAWIKSLTLSRINTPEVDMVNLRQWVHVKITANVTLKGLYVQPIVGPMGLPFGEFNVDFPCVDYPDSKNINETGQLTYCHYRPRTTIQHPKVYVGYSEKGQTVFHMHFFWIDVTCMETPYLQFLILAVKDFHHYDNGTTRPPRVEHEYKPILSPIYLNTDFDSKSGAPFPYYPDWREQMYCNLDAAKMDKLYRTLYPDTIISGIPQKGYPSDKNGSDAYFADINWKEMNSTLNVARIQASEQYDSCLTKRMRDTSLFNEARLECPPGPFRCASTYADPNTTRDDITKQRQELVEAEKNTTNCFPCGAPPCVEIGYPAYKCDGLADNLIQDRNDTLEISEASAIIASKSHGVQAMFAFLVLVPLANFIARFYKEMCGQCLFENGPWIYVHIGANVLSILLMYVAIGPVIPKLTEIRTHAKECAAKAGGELKSQAYKDCLTEGSTDNPHVALAIVAFLMQHCLVAMGFFRSTNQKIRSIQTTLHSHFGYLCWLLGALSSIVIGYKLNVQNNCPAILVISLLLTFTPFVFSAAGVTLDCLTDKKVGVIPPRRQWPILEPIKLEGRGPYTTPKWIIYGLFVMVMILYWFLALSDSMTVISSTDSAAGRKATKINGMFGDNCKRLQLPNNSAAARPELVTTAQRATESTIG